MHKHKISIDDEHQETGRVEHLEQWVLLVQGAFKIQEGKK